MEVLSKNVSLSVNEKGDPDFIESQSIRAISISRGSAMVRDRFQQADEFNDEPVILTILNLIHECQSSGGDLSILESQKEELGRRFSQWRAQQKVTGSPASKEADSARDTRSSERLQCTSGTALTTIKEFDSRAIRTTSRVPVWAVSESSLEVDIEKKAEGILESTKSDDTVDRGFVSQGSAFLQRGSPVFYTARSSPWLGSNLQASPLPFTGSPMSSVFYSARSSPYGFIHSSPVSLRTPFGFSTRQSPASGYSLSTLQEESREPHKPPPSEFIKAAQARGLILPIIEELNWSGKTNGGQHVEYAVGEELPLQPLGTIGMSLTATVDKVRCRRILLARKTVKCSRKLSVHDALVEVEHLHKLRHPHIIQLVGTYLQGRKFAVLLYPVADCDLGVFLEDVHDQILKKPNTELGTQRASAISALWSFFGCLTDALMYIHTKATKHLDIKPGNILVKTHSSYFLGHRVYIADFGISRSFPSLDLSQTDAPIPRTPKYCAPEVWYREAHGRAADVFSLGCVFMEMLTILCGRSVDDFTDFRSMGSDENVPYHMSLDRVFQWGDQLLCMKDLLYRLDILPFRVPGDVLAAFKFSRSTVWLETTLKMLQEDPENRRIQNTGPTWSKSNYTGQEQTCSFCHGSREVYREED